MSQRLSVLTQLASCLIVRKRPVKEWKGGLDGKPRFKDSPQLCLKKKQTGTWWFNLKVGDYTDSGVLLHLHNTVMAGQSWSTVRFSLAHQMFTVKEVKEWWMKNYHNVSMLFHFMRSPWMCRKSKCKSILWPEWWFVQQVGQLRGLQILLTGLSISMYRFWIEWAQNSFSAVAIHQYQLRFSQREIFRGLIWKKGGLGTPAFRGGQRESC